MIRFSYIKILNHWVKILTKRVLNILKDYGPVISAIALIVAIWSVTQSNRTAHKIANGDYQAEQQIKTEEVH